MRENVIKRSVDVHGTSILVEDSGEGRPILFLPSAQGLFGADDFLERLGRLGRLTVPDHPGFGASELPQDFTAVEDYSYLYLDLMDQLSLQDVVLVGSSFGGWIAAEMAVRDRSRIGRLVLIDTLGFKFNGREARDIVDMHAVSDEALRPLYFHEPDLYAPDYREFGEGELVTVARARETFAYIGWKPYMHSPKLRSRLHRISCPTLVLWGASDGIVGQDYGRRIAAEIPNARFEVIERAGHFPYVEQPEPTAKSIERFI